MQQPADNRTITVIPNIFLVAIYSLPIVAIYSLPIVAIYSLPIERFIVISLTYASAPVSLCIPSGVSANHTDMGVTPLLPTFKHIRIKFRNESS